MFGDETEEACKVCPKAVLVASGDGSGFTSAILREPGPIYDVGYDKVSLFC